MNKKTMIIFFFIFTLVVFFDQGLKIWTVNNMHLHEIREIPFLYNIVRLNYILNPGLINGFLLSGKYVKILFLMFRLVFLIFIFRFTIMNKKNKSIVAIIKSSLIISGGVGNTVDWIFYGIFFNNAPVSAPFRLGYGQVVDMLQLKIPSFIPVYGGKYFTMVFNIADFAILIGIALYLFQNNRKK